MSNSIDLVRFSHKALPIARKFDSDGNKSLDSVEYNSFMSVWNKENGSESPLLMQLHMDTLTDEARKIAEECDTDELKGVLTELEIQSFMDKYDASGLKKVFKDNVDVSEVITGQRQTELAKTTDFEPKNNNIFNRLGVKWALFNNWLKLDVMNYMGTDKFFHAVGNFEAMLEGSEDEVKKVCAGQDEDKRSHMQRPEADYTEDLYANWLGREFAKIYPDKNPHELFKPLAPEKFDTEESKNNIAQLTYDKATGEESWLGRKFKQYKDYFAEEFISERFKKELKDLFGLNA